MTTTILYATQLDHRSGAKKKKLKFKKKFLNYLEKHGATLTSAYPFTKINIGHFIERMNLAKYLQLKIMELMSGTFQTTRCGIKLLAIGSQCRCVRLGNSIEFSF